MPKNNVDQAPKIRSIGNKEIKGLTWGKAIRPHELETIFANCIDTKNFVQYKVMMFLTGQAEEKFDVSIANVMNRCNVSKDAYYRARTALAARGWLSFEDDGDKSYIVIHYDKIYQDGKEQCTFLNYPLEESKLENYTDESNCETISDEKESKFETYSDEGKFNNTTDESNCENTSQNEGNCKITSEGNCYNTNESKSDNSQYSIYNNTINNNIEEIVEQKMGDWGPALGDRNHLSGPACNF